jgi:hypothetical protein
MTQQVVSYQLGPISAGANSPLGGFFGFIQGLSSNYATGLNAAVNAPAASAHIIGGGNVTASDVAALQAAEQKGLSDNPFVSLGQILGGIAGTGVTAGGTIVGVSGTTASPGIATGASSAVTGITSAASAGVAGGASGLLPGLSSGIGAALGNSGIGTGGAGGFGSTFLLIAGGLILVLLFVTLR